LHEESININSRLESEDRLRSRLMVENVYYNFFEDQELIMGNSAKVIPSIFHDENEIFK